MRIPASAKNLDFHVAQSWRAHCNDNGSHCDERSTHDAKGDLVLEKLEPVSRPARIDERNIDLFLCSIEPGFRPALEMLSHAPRVTEVPRMQSSETAEVFELVFELAGVTSADIDVKTTRDIVSVSAKRRMNFSEESSDKSWHRQELPLATLERTVLLPEGLDTDDVAMKFVDGLLTIRIAKADESRKRRPRRLHS